MLPSADLKDLPGFFSFRWSPLRPIEGFTDISIVFKVPGRVDLSSIPDLVENVCRGPFVPDAVVLVHLTEDSELPSALADGAASNSLVRFHGRLPLLRMSLSAKGGRPTVTMVRPSKSTATIALRDRLKNDVSDWLRVGLSKIFDPSLIIVRAPPGYAYQKPSQRKASYFVRAEQGLESSGRVAFVALCVWRRLMEAHLRGPGQLMNVFVDSMGVATVAYALRELFSLANIGTPPQVESFHSYGGFDFVKPLAGSSLCLISASSSMSLHRQWVNKKHVPDRDVLTLVTFDDASDKEFALFCLPAKTRPSGEEVTAAYDIKIKGENFVPLAEVPRSVLLRKPIHGDEKAVRVFHELYGQDVFRLFRNSTKSNPRRRGIYCDGSELRSQAKIT